MTHEKDNAKLKGYHHFFLITMNCFDKKNKFLTHKKIQHTSPPSEEEFSRHEHLL